MFSVECGEARLVIEINVLLTPHTIVIVVAQSVIVIVVTLIQCSDMHDM